MSARGLLAAAAGLALLLLASACRTELESAARGPRPPRPVLALAGQARARRVADWPELPPGPGAEGMPGDLLLENELVRFVVGAADREGAALSAGHLLDAAVQGGEDRMRLLAPLLGPAPGRTPVCSRVYVADAGGLDTPAVVVAEGALPDRRPAGVVTTYTLPPASPMLEVATRVENGGDAMLPVFELRDVLYHGRTLRFVPELGFMPIGRQGPSMWLCFSCQDYAWGLLCAPLGRMEGVHEVGLSRLGYGTVDIPPGEGRTYRRFVVAVAGGPEQVWRAAYPTPERSLSHLSVVLTDRETDEPVPGARVMLTPSAGRPPVLMFTGPAGSVQLDLPAGHYRVSAGAPGRPPAGSVTVECAAGQGHRLAIPLLSPAEAIVRVSAKLGDFIAPSPARVTCYGPAGTAAPYPPPPPFPSGAPQGLALTDGTAELRVPLTPRSAALPGRALVVASRGPLFEHAAAPVAAAAGESRRLDLQVERVVEARGYVSVDMRQRSQASPDCALTQRERLLANACEGLEAAVVSDPVPSFALPGAGEEVGSCLLTGRSLDLPGIGSFSVYPLAPPVGGSRAGHRSVCQVPADLRRAYPEALVQVDAPLEPGRGYFALGGPGAARGGEGRPGSGLDFDAIEILSGDDVESARRLLPRWFRLLNDGRRPLITGGSGSRDTAYELAGIARTFVHCPTAGRSPTAGEIEAAIRGLKGEPNAFVTNGPFIEATLNGAAVGSTQTPEGQVARLRLSVRAPSWVDVTGATVYRNGEPVHELQITPTRAALRCDRVLEVDAGSDCWFVVVVEGQRPMTPVYPGGRSAPRPFAVTNPFWVDADGDGAVLPGR